MISIYTPERAERLARAFDAQPAYVVKRLGDGPIVETRTILGIIIATKVYARVSRAGVHRLNITYEYIHAESEIW